MKISLIAAMLMAAAMAQDVDWGKIIDQQSTVIWHPEYHPTHPTHPNPTSPVPEPGTYLLVGGALAGVAYWRMRNK